jgi:hypothetical protein
MDPQVPTSFIPKKPVTTAYSKPQSSVSILLLASVVLFLAAVLAAGGSFAYLQYLKQSISNKSASLERSRKAFEPAVIAELVRLDSRMRHGEEILSSHVSASAIFAFLEQSTLESVRFRDFSFALSADGGAVALEGEARTFSDVALQSDEFGKQRVLKDVYFDNINTDQAGKVTFSVRASVDPAFLLYVNAVANQGL